MDPTATANAPLFTRRVVRVLLLAAFSAGVIFLLGWAYDVVLTIFAGAVLGVFLHGLARWLAQRTRFSYRGALAAIIVLILSLTVFAVWAVGPALAAQIDQLVVQVPAAVKDLGARSRGLPLVHGLAGGLTQFGLVAGAAVKAVRLGFEAVAGFVVALVIGVYSATDPGSYLRGLLRMVPIHARPRAEEVIDRTTRSLLRWLVGQLLLMVVVGTMTAIGLKIAGIPLAFALGLLAGVMTYIPYLGVLLSMGPALLVALSAGPIKMLWVLVVFAIAHGFEGYILSPLIAKRTVKFPPAFTIGVQILLGAIWGVLGFAFATPIAVVATQLVEALYVEDTLGDRAPGARVGSSA